MRFSNRGIAGSFGLLMLALGTASADPIEVCTVDGRTVERHVAGAVNYVPGMGADYEWWYGCTATSAGMLMAHYDRNGYNGMSYANLVPGGVAEALSHSDGGGALLGNQATASKQYGVTWGKGHVEDFWVAYDSLAADPLASGRTLPGGFNCLADFMGTSQNWNTNTTVKNSDGATSFWFYNEGNILTAGALFDYGAQYYESDAMCGISEYLQYRGYTPDNEQIYSQKIDAAVAGGFSFAQYCTEIDAGRPVLLHVEGHTMLGVGYDTTATNTVKLYDTWSAGTHDMTWGGSYAGLPQTAVGVVHLPDGEANMEGGQADCSYEDSLLDIVAGLPDGAPVLDITMSVDNLALGTNSFASLKFFYEDEDLTAAGVTDESLLSMYWLNATVWESAAAGTRYLGTPQGVLGDYGVDTANNYAWVNVNHASEWVVTQIPEPALLPLVLAFPVILRWWRRRQR